MNIELLMIGKTDSPQIEHLVVDYTKRINHYCKLSITTIPDLKGGKSLSIKQQRTSEGESILKLINDSDYVVLLDERGGQYRSIEFAQWMQKRMNSSLKRLVFVIGGAYGLSEEVYARANGKISLSAMTFSHQIVRAIFLEQIYRSFTILRNEPYHHE